MADDSKNIPLDPKNIALLRENAELAIKKFSILSDQLLRYNKILSETNDFTKESATEVKKKIQETEKNIELLESEIENQEKHNIIAKESIEKLKEILQLYKKQDRELKQNNKNVEETIEKLNELENLYKTTTDGAYKFLTSLTGISKEAKSFAGQFIQSSNGLLGFNNTLSATGKGVAKFFGADNLRSTSLFGKSLETIGNFSTNIFTSGLDKIIEVNKQFVKDFIESEKQIYKYTGAGREATKVLYESWNATTQYGVSIKEVSESMIQLSKNVNKFNQMSVEERKEITQLSSMMSQLGINASDSSRAYNNLTVSLKMSSKEAQKFERELVDIGAMLGDNDAGVKAFNESLRVLSAYQAPRATQVFKELALQSYATGVEINKLLDIAGKFDTFEDAATASAKLNAILGGPLLNSTDLLLQSENERIDTIMKSMHQSNKMWDSLDKYERKAIASAVGITDMAEANKIFGKSFDEYQKGLITGQKTLEQQKALEERAKEAQSVTDRWNALLQQLVINLEPVVRILEWMINGIIELNEATGGYLLPILGVLIGSMAALKMIFFGAVGAINSVNAAFGVTSKVAPQAAEGVNKSLTKLGSGGAAAFKGLAIAAGITVIFIGFAYAAKLLAEAAATLIPYLGELFSVMSQYKGQLALISAELLVFGFAMNIFGSLAPAVAIGSVALMGAGWAINYFLDQLKGDGELESFISNLATLSTNIGELTRLPGILNSITQSVISMNDELSKVSGKILINVLFDDMIENKLNNYLEMVSRLVNTNALLKVSSEDYVSSFKPITNFTSEVNNLSEEKVKFFERITNSTVRIIESSKESGDNTKEIVDSIKQLISVVQNTSTNSTNTKQVIEVMVKGGINGELSGQGKLTPKG